MSRYGVREICDVTFKALTSVDIGNQHFDAGQPVLILDTAKTSSLEGAATTVYAQGGKGNPRLIGWDGEKTLTFTVEDALISAESFAMLSGAGIVRGVGKADATEGQKVYVHTMYDLVIEAGSGNTLYAKLPQDVRDGATLVVSKEAPVYAVTLDNAGAPKHFLSAISQNEIFTNSALTTKATIGKRGVVEVEATDDLYFKIDATGTKDYLDDAVIAGDSVKIDCYTVHGAGATELQIDAENFAGYYYIEADTLFREEATGQDLPAQFVIPRGKIQSNFTFTMANSGDPSTFTFTIDCFPAYTKFNKTKKVLATLQVLDPTDVKHNYAKEGIYGHKDRTADDDAYFTGLYDKSVFDPIATTTSSSGGSGTVTP